MTTTPVITASLTIPPLENGDKLTRWEFEYRDQFFADRAVIGDNNRPLFRKDGRWCLNPLPCLPLLNEM